jgi:enamine deaminase RidA (YjgF/YER057c/UK114 family)
MAVTFHQPADLVDVPLYRHVSVATGSRLVFVAGQVAGRDEHGTRIGEGDLAAQLDACFANAAIALSEVGATFADVAKMTVFVAGWEPALFPALEEGYRRAGARLGAAVRPPASLIGVSMLAEPDILCELEVTAVLDEARG